MTIFGRILDTQDIFALISMLMVLGLWLVVLRRERPGVRGINWILMQRERDKRADTASADRPAAPADGEPKGPWG